MIFLRWYVSRIYTDDRFAEAPKRTVDVTVQPCTQQMTEELGEDALDTLATREDEILDWWIEDEAETLEGRIREEVLLQAVCEHHASAAVDDALITAAQRQLAEDMVLVQKLDDRSRFDEELQRERGSTDQLELDELARANGSKWIDLTQQARRATSVLYLKALGDAESEGSQGDQP